MPCPSEDRLAAAIEDYVDLGIDTVVSLLPETEMAELGVKDEPQLCATHGLRFVTLPIVDFGLPEKAAFIVLVQKIRVLVHAGQSVAVHCRAGIGRSGMTTVGSLIALGWDTTDAFAQVSKARGVAVPDTVEQAAFIAELAPKLQSTDV